MSDILLFFWVSLRPPFPPPPTLSSENTQQQRVCGTLG